MTLESITLSSSVTATPTGLVFHSDVGFEEWQQIGGKLKELRGMVHWWIGDWLNYGERRWGEKYTQALEDTAYAYQTLANDKYVASRFQVSRRRESLKWHHHAAVAGMEPDEQERLLDIAEDKELNRDAFRALITARKEDMEFYNNLMAYPAIHKSEWDGVKLSRYHVWLQQGEEFFK
jgi:hypothetical protein